LQDEFHALTWVPPSDPNGMIKSYDIEYKKNDDSVSDRRVTILS